MVLGRKERWLREGENLKSGGVRSKRFEDHKGSYLRRRGTLYVLLYDRGAIIAVDRRLDSLVSKKDQLERNIVHAKKLALYEARAHLSKFEFQQHYTDYNNHKSQLSWATQLVSAPVLGFVN